jgi:DNA-binding CsgD family transcriptional regulator
MATLLDHLALAQPIAKDGQAALKIWQAKDPFLLERETRGINTLGERDMLRAWGEVLLFFDTNTEALAHTIDNAGLSAAFLQAALESIPEEKGRPFRHKPQASYGELTARERQVVALIARGKSNRAIAGELVLSEWTVENHIARIFGKLGFDFRAQIAVRVVKSGLDGNEPQEN